MQERDPKVVSKFEDMRSLIFTLLTLSCTILNAEEQWLSPIRNYTKAEYKAGTQNWMIFRDDNGWIYSANNEGLLLYDGHDWDLSPYATGPLRVLKKGRDERLYVGSYNKFGFYETEADGELVYRSLSDKIHDSIENFSDIWDIYETGDSLYFISYNYVFKLLDGEISAIYSPERILASAFIGDNLYVFREGKGIFLQNGHGFELLPGSEKLQTQDVTEILPYHGDGFLLVTEYDGIYVFSDSRLRPFKTDIEPLLRNSQVYCAATWRDKIYVGTIKNGLFIIDTNGGKTQRCDMNTGLQNNSILSMAITPAGNVWLGLDNGISYIELASPISNLYTGKYDCGVGYTSIIHEGRLYLGTNQGLFYTDWPISNVYNPDLKPVADIDGQVWSLTEIDGTLFCGHNNGAFVIDGEKARLIFGKDGIWNFQLIPGSRDRIVAGTYTGLVTFVNRGSRNTPDWRFEKKLPGIDISCLKVEYDKYDKSWWISYDMGRYRVTADQNLNEIKSVTDFPDTTGRAEVSIFKDRGRVFFPSSEGIFYYDPAIHDFCLSRKWSDRLQEKGYVEIVGIDRYDNVWYTKNGTLRRNYPAGTSFRTDSLGLKYLSGKMMDNYENILVINDKAAVIGTLGGFSLYNMKTGSLVSDNYFDLTIRRLVFTSGQEERVLYQDNGIRTATDAPDLVVNKYRKECSYRFEMNPLPGECSIHYGIQLKGVNRRPIEMDASGIKEYTGLTEGNYKFTVYATDLSTNEVFSKSIRLKILPPWYRSIPAYIIYILALTGTCCWLVNFMKRYIRLQNYKQMIAQQKEAYKVELALKSEALEKEKTIIELRNEALEQDLRIKSQELANSMFNIIQKREIFLFMKDELAKISRALNSSNQEEALHKVNRLSEKIRQNIDEEESWKKLEDNFNIVHRNFLTRLKERYPDLSSNDLKLAAYIRMDLLTKEIAPLLNISERGLESARFRLRKKLGIGKNESLSKFLKNF